MPPGSPPASSFTAGKPAIYTQIRVVDQSGHDAKIGAPGEVWIRGPAVMQGYWENEQATRDAFCDGWFRNGDLGAMDAAGYLRIVDRLNDIIIVGGSNVYPTDLETVLKRLPRNPRSGRGRQARRRARRGSRRLPCLPRAGRSRPSR